MMILLALLIVHSLNFQSFGFDIFSSIVQFLQNLLNSLFGKGGITTASTTTTSQTSLSTSISTSSTTVPTSSYSTTTIKQNTTLSQNVQYTNNFIVYSPVNLTNITYISKFRSCWGHDISVLVPGTNGTREPLSSKRHYFGSPSFSKVQLYAPFTGNVVYIDKSTELGHDIYIQGPTSGNWVFDILHLDILPSIKINTTVKAGQLIGYANNSQQGQADIDVDLLEFGGNLTAAAFSQFQQYINSSNPSQQVPPSILKNYYNSTYDSIFRHMNGSVYNQYLAHGASLPNMIFSLQYRQNNPCTCQGNTMPGCHFINNQYNQTVVITH